MCLVSSNEPDYEGGGSTESRDPIRSLEDILLSELDNLSTLQTPQNSVILGDPRFIVVLRACNT